MVRPGELTYYGLARITYITSVTVGSRLRSSRVQRVTFLSFTNNLVSSIFSSCNSGALLQQIHPSAAVQSGYCTCRSDVRFCFLTAVQEGRAKSLRQIHRYPTIKWAFDKIRHKHKHTDGLQIACWASRFKHVACQLHTPCSFDCEQLFLLHCTAR